jgi:hypothetical protein
MVALCRKCEEHRRANDMPSRRKGPPALAAPRGGLGETAEKGSTSSTRGSVMRSAGRQKLEPIGPEIWWRTGACPGLRGGSQLLLGAFMGERGILPRLATARHGLPGLPWGWGPSIWIRQRLALEASKTAIWWKSGGPVGAEPLAEPDRRKARIGRLRASGRVEEGRWIGVEPHGMADLSRRCFDIS